MMDRQTPAVARGCFLSDVLVVDLGGRPAVSACGSLLAQLGAAVVLVEAPGEGRNPHRQWMPRPLIAAGKMSVGIDPGAPADLDFLRSLLRHADVILTTGDEQPRWMHDLLPAPGEGALLCDINSFGRTGPLAGQVYPDLLIQAITGLMDTTGDTEGTPTACRFPLVEYVTATYAVVGVLAALRARREQGISQAVEVALYDCALSTLTTFVPGYLAGRKPLRIGNHHPSMSPWNAYRAKDGWVLMCSGSDDQWRRVCELIGQRELAADDRYASPSKRVQASAEVDRIVEAWTRERSVAECVERFNSASLSCGPVTPIAGLFTEPNLVYRGMFSSAKDPQTGAQVTLPGSVFRGSVCSGIGFSSIPALGHDRAQVAALVARRTPRPPAASSTPPRPVLEGVRVIEIGNYTAGPFVSRQLGALGAYVVKVEPPGGDLARALPPHRDGQSYFFTMSNHDKRSLMLDLRKDEDKARLRDMLKEADVLVENLRPGSLARMGFSAADLARLNPRLIYCTVSGYGTDAPYADRAGMDTTIQGGAGIMHLTQSAGVPYKNGISSADIAAGLFGLAGVLAALEYRQRTGRGQAIDISMQDAAAWLTHTAWNAGLAAGDEGVTIACADGYVAACANASAVAAAIGTPGAVTSETIAARDKSCDEIAALLAAREISCAPVRSVSEAVEHPQTVARQFIVTGLSVAGKEWPLLACPLRLTATPPAVQRAIGAIGADAAEIAADWKSFGTRDAVTYERSA